MDEKQLFEGILKGQFHQGGIKCLKLFDVDAHFFEKLKNEALTFVQQFSPSDVSQAGHITHWTAPFGKAVQFSLLNASGKPDDTSTDHNSSTQGKRFHHATSYPTLAQWISFFPHAINMRLNGMGQKSGLSPHEERILNKDPKAKKKYLKVRFHLPLQTNPQAHVLMDGELFHFEAGSIYYFNNGTVHSARNLGQEMRFHLVWDMLLTKETFELMFLKTTAPNMFTPRKDQAQEVRPVGEVAVTSYQTTGRVQKWFDLCRLDRIYLKPYQVQNVVNWMMRHLPQHVEFSDLR